MAKHYDVARQRIVGQPPNEGVDSTFRGTSS